MNEALIAELKVEAASTRKLPEGVPVEKTIRKHTQRPMWLGKPAAHIAILPGWVTGNDSGR